MKNFLNFFLPSLNRSNTTPFDVFEKVFSGFLSVTMCSSVFCDLILAVKLARFFATLKNFLNFFLLSLNHLNRTVSDLL